MASVVEGFTKARITAADRMTRLRKYPKRPIPASIYLCELCGARVWYMSTGSHRLHCPGRATS